MVRAGCLAWAGVILTLISASPEAEAFSFLPHFPYKWAFRLLENEKSNKTESETCLSSLERSKDGKFTVYLDDPRCRTIVEANAVTRKLVYGDPLQPEARVKAGVRPGSVRLEDVRYDLRHIPKGLEAKMMNKFGFKVRGKDQERETEICRDMKRIAVTYLSAPKDTKARALVRHLHRHVFPANGWNDTSLFFISGVGKPPAIVPRRWEAALKRLKTTLHRVSGHKEQKVQISHDEIVRRLREESERERDMILSPFVENYEVLMEKVHGAVSFVSRCRTYRQAHASKSEKHREQQAAEIFLHLDSDGVLNWPLFFAVLKAGPDVFWKKEWRETMVEKHWTRSEYIKMLRKREADASTNAHEEEREQSRMIDEADDARVVGGADKHPDALPDLVGREDCLEPDAPLMMGHVYGRPPIYRSSRYAQYSYVKGLFYAPYVNGPITILNGPAVDRIAAAYDNDRVHYRNGDASLGQLGDRTKVCPIHLPGATAYVSEVPAGCLLPNGKRTNYRKVLPPWLHHEMEWDAADLHQCPCSFAFAAVHCTSSDSCRRDLLNRQFFPCNKTLSDAVLWNRDGTEAQQLRYFDRVADRQDPKMPLPIAPPNKLPLSFW